MHILTLCLSLCLKAPKLIQKMGSSSKSLSYSSLSDFESFSIATPESSDQTMANYFSDARHIVAEIFGLFRFTMEQGVDFLEFSLEKAVHLLQFFVGMFANNYAAQKVAGNIEFASQKNSQLEVKREEEEEGEPPLGPLKNHWIF